ncbi:hypothetical protein [Ideonella sp. BN130291]|uniref:hypothetical protein n=1 Tax=Ideonella sp. BN130291 TaxID=3112940 RepID=UPI002E2546A8|nr:hypothetical protein [Ideonella sp. BN130291]
MRHLLIAALVLASPVWAAETPPPADPLHTVECRDALNALQVEEERATASAASAPRQPPRPGSAVDKARHRAARACLRSQADPPPAGRMAQPAVSVPSTSLPSAALPPMPRPAVPATPAPPVAMPPPPTVVTHCDAGGCWASDGSRVNRIGSTVVGPRGACTPMGATLVCP